LSRVDKRLLQYNYEIEENNAFEKDNLRSCLLYKLRLMGHNASVQQAFINSSVNAQMKINRDENNQQEAKEIFEAEAFESLEIAKEENKKNFNLKTKRRYEKTKILTALPEIENSDIWCEDFILKCFVKDKHCLSQYQRYWLLSNP
jgi:hypothetical protein